MAGIAQHAHKMCHCGTTRGTACWATQDGAHQWARDIVDACGGPGLLGEALLEALL